MKGSAPPNIINRVASFLQGQGYAQRQEPLVVAVSGGPDSVCLLHVLVQLRQSLRLALHLAHLDHGLRGQEAKDDAKYAATLADQWDVPSTLAQRDVVEYRKARSLTLEQAAREVRYAFLGQVALEVGASAIVLGHTADDQVETILLNLVRGSGLQGIAGMRAVSRLKLAGLPPVTLLRPLLEIERSAIEDYCQRNHISPRFDTTNRDTYYRRNAIRHQVVPLLMSLNPGVKQALLRFARSAQQDLEIIEAEAEKAWGSVARASEDSAIIFHAARNLPGSLQHHLVRKAVQHVQGDLFNLQSSHVEAIVSLLGNGAGPSVSLPRGLIATATYEGVSIGPTQAQECNLLPLLGEHLLAVPGETAIPGWKVTALVKKSPCLFVRERGKSDQVPSGYTAWLDYDKVGPKLMARARRRGDRFQPLGMQGEKKLQDFMVDAKIPRLWRDRMPLVCSPAGILWVVGHRIDERAGVTPSTKEVLEVKFEPL